MAGFFIVGFLTETPEEIKATVDYALRSDMNLATSFTVTPQPETPLYEPAKIANLAALKRKGATPIVIPLHGMT